MVDAISTALSGLKAQQVRLSATASNIANAQTAGSPPSATAASTVYRPLSVSLTAQEAGGVTATVVERPNGYSLVSDPQSPYADAAGNVAVPNVDYAEEAVATIETRTAFKANLAVLRVQEELNDELLNTIKDRD